jgi:hypothetical protein
MIRAKTTTTRLTSRLNRYNFLYPYPLTKIEGKGLFHLRPAPLPRPHIPIATQILSWKSNSSPLSPPAPRDHQRLHCPRGDAGRCPQQQPQFAALQDPLHQQQLLPHPHSAGPQFHLHRGPPRFYELPAHDHPGGEPPQLPDRGARPHALRRCQADGGVCRPGPQADLQRGDHPALLACAGPASAEDDRVGRLSVLHLRRRESSGERAGKDLL